MKRINFRGNLPSHIGIFAKKLGGIFSKVKDTEFWEATSIDEFEKNASEVGYEIIPTIDASTDRAYLVGFDAEDSQVVSVDGDSYSQLKMYFIEITPAELKAWDKKIRAHRDAQMEDMRLREGQSQKAHEKAKKRVVQLKEAAEEEAKK